MISPVEDELRAQISEFAKSDEALKEVIARLSELESLSSAHRLSKDSLDSSTRSLNQLAADLGSLLTTSTSSVGDIARVVAEMGGITQRLETETVKAITSKIKMVTEKIQKTETQIEDAADSQREGVAKLLASIDGVALHAETSSTSIMERLEALETSSVNNARRSAVRTWIIFSVATLIVGGLTIAILI
jgi:uncharacterized membrane protein YccC